MKWGIWLGVLCWCLLLSACGTYRWYKQADPATTIIIRQHSPDAVAKRCAHTPGAGACATIGGPVCVVDFVGAWHADWQLLDHELRHCAGYNHRIF